VLVAVSINSQLLKAYVVLLPLFSGFVATESKLSLLGISFFALLSFYSTAQTKADIATTVSDIEESLI
jgi:hypothetical protein